MKRKRGRPPKGEEALKEPGWFKSLRPETRHSILAIFSFAITLLLILTMADRAGVVGEKLYGLLDPLFGVALFLVPLVFFLAGISFLFSLRSRIVAATVIGAFLMLVSVLGITDAVFGGQTAGHVGFIISSPLLRFFDFWATIVILAALFIISFLLMLNLSLKLKPRVKDSDDVSEEKSSFAGVTEAIHAIKQELLKERGNPLKRAEDWQSPEGEGDDRASNILPEEEEEEQEEEEEVMPGEVSPPIFFKKKISPSTLEQAFVPPPLDLLENDKGKPTAGDIKANANIIKRTLQNFGITVEMGEVNIGPSITQYTLRPAEGVKISRIIALHNDIALTLAAHPIRIEAPIPGKSLVGIEIPNRSIALVGMRSILSQSEFQHSKAELLLGFGRDVSGKTVYRALEKMPHLLVAGSTGSGKSVAIHAMMMSLLYRNPPERLRFLLIDPKRVELSAYSGIPHILTPVITDPKKAILALKWATGEMERRYDLLNTVSARDIHSYQESQHSIENPMPYIVIVIDELADMMAVYPREMEAVIVRLAQMSRAVGIHLIVSTQRPSVEVITGLIKANITSRMAFQVASQVDSRTILDVGGSEKLLGNGDMLYLAGDAAKPRRVQGAFVSEPEVRKVVQYLEGKYEGVEMENLNLEPESGSTSMFDIFNNREEDADDKLYKQAEEVIIQTGKASASYLQRKLRVGYARAARLLDLLESRGIIGPADGAKPRDVLIKKEDLENAELWKSGDRGEKPFHESL